MSTTSCPSDSNSREASTTASRQALSTVASVMQWRGEPGDPKMARIAVTRREERPDRRWCPGRIPRPTTGELIEHRRRVAHGPGDRPGRRQTHRVAVHGVTTDPPPRGLEAEQPAARGRDPDGAATVRALGHGDQSGRHRRGRAAGGAAGHPGPVPGRDRGRPALGLGVARRAELRRRGLAEADHARGLERQGDAVGDVRHEVGVDRRAERRADALGQVEVLDGRRHAVERRAGPALQGLELTRAGARQVVGERDERAHRRRRVVVDAMGAFEVVLDELERRHLALPDERALLEGGQVVQLGHASTLGRVPQLLVEAGVVTPGHTETGVRAAERARLVSCRDACLWRSGATCERSSRPAIGPVATTTAKPAQRSGASSWARAEARGGSTSAVRRPRSPPRSRRAGPPRRAACRAPRGRRARPRRSTDCETVTSSTTIAPAMPAERSGVGVRPLAAVRRRGGADHAEGLAGERALAVGPREPVDGVVEDGRHGAVVLGRHRQDAVRAADPLAQGRRRGGDVGPVDVLVVERQLVEAVDQVEGHALGRLVAQQLGQLAVRWSRHEGFRRGRRRGSRTWVLLWGRR